MLRNAHNSLNMTNFDRSMNFDMSVFVIHHGRLCGSMRSTGNKSYGGYCSSGTESITGISICTKSRHKSGKKSTIVACFAHILSIPVIEYTLIK